MRIRSVLPLLPLLALAACAEAGGAASLDADDLELQAPTGDVKADSAVAAAAAQGATYYAIQVDQRKCAAPLCGGYLVHRVNFARTKCDDGHYHDVCYVVDLDLENGVGLDADEAAAFRRDIASGRALVRGSIRSATYGAATLGFFVPTEAWRAATDVAPSGTFYKVTDRHVQCLAAPCPTYLQTKLNSTTQDRIDDLDLSGAGTEDTDVAAVVGAIDQTPVMAVGADEAYNVSGRAGTRLVASQYYLAVVHGGTSATTPAAEDLVGRSFSADGATPFYPRSYTFTADGVTVADAVAPCPAGATCIWSGVVTRAATWSLAGDRVRLDYAGAASPDGAGGNLVYAGELAARRDNAGGLVLVEVAADGTLGARVFR
jgi:hypothetical protein